MGPVPIRNAEERAAAEEIIGKETTQMYRSPEMIDLYMRDVLTEKTDIWVSRVIGVYASQLDHEEMYTIDILSNCNSFYFKSSIYYITGTGMYSVYYVFPPAPLSRRWLFRHS